MEVQGRPAGRRHRLPVSQRLPGRRCSAWILGRDEDVIELDTLAGRTRQAFNEHYVADDGTISSDAPTAYALAIVFGLLDPEAAHRAGVRLAELVAANGYRISTGFAGTPFVTDASDDDRPHRRRRTRCSWSAAARHGSTR